MARLRSPRRPTSSRLRFEALEGRLMLNGNVTVGLNRYGDLTVRGDSAGNGVVITQTGAGTYEIVGIDAGATPGPTTINGKDDVVTMTVRRNVTIDLGGGPDLLAFGDGANTVSVPGKLTIRTGSGNDQVQLNGVEVNSSVAMNTGSGNDQVRLYTVSAQKSADVRTGGGADAVFVEGCDFLKNFRVLGGFGNDLVAVGADTTVGKDTSIKTGFGRDTVVVLGLTTGNHFGLNAGFNSDTVDMTTQGTVTSNSDPDDSVTKDLATYTTSNGDKFSADDNFVAARDQFLAATATVAVPLTSQVTGVHLGFGNDKLTYTDNVSTRTGIGGGLGNDKLYTLGQYVKNAVYGPTRVAHFNLFPNP